MPGKDTTTSKADEVGDEAEDVVRLSRDHDDIDPDSPLGLRLLRQWAWHGKPIGQPVELAFKLPDSDPLIFGAVTATKNDRLVFWPMLPTGRCMSCGDIKAVDHITLELPSEESHATGYKTNRKAVRQSPGWKIHHCPGSGMALWFFFLVKLSVLREQPRAAWVEVVVPATDRQRRVDELNRYIRDRQLALLTLHNRSETGDYVAAAVYLVTGPLNEQTFPASVFPSNLMAPEVTGWPNELAPIDRAKVAVGTRAIAVATARPAGTPNEDMVIGFP